MILKRKSRKLGIIIVLIIAALGAFLFFPNLLYEEKVTKQKTRVFIDSLKREELVKILELKKEDFQLVNGKNEADVLLTKGEQKHLETIDSAQEFYIPVESFLNQVENVDSTKIKKIFKKEITNWKELGGEDLEIKILVLDVPEIKLVFNEFFGIEKLDFEKTTDLEDLISKVSKDRRFISILPLEKVNSKVNSISIDDISPIKSKDFSSYPLKISYFLQSKKKNSKEQSIVHAIKEYLSKYKGETVELIAVGDIMLSRHVGEKIREAKDNSLPFKKLFGLLSSADITFANLESPFFNQGQSVKEGMVFKAEPETIEGLKLAGIDLISLANNHFGNQGRAGMVYTFNHLKNNNISYFGAGNNIEEAHTPTLLESRGTRFAFLSYNEVSPESYKAGGDKAGLAWISENEEDLARMEKDIKKAKERADVTVLSFHWGVEYKVNPNSKQRNIAQRAVNAGADIILAQHPHVVQGLDFIDDKFIAYSLGNFVFDQMWSEETKEGLVVRVYIKGSKVLDIDLIPIKIENFNQPRLANTQESGKILTRVYSASFSK